MVLGLLLGLGVGLQSNQQVSAKTKYYTNPATLRRHNWYAHTNMYNGNWRYERLHFAKHSVYIAGKTSKSGKWHNSHIPAKYYFFQKKGGWYRFGTRESDDVMTIQKPTYRYLDGHKKWTLGMFDPSNDNGGYQTSSPYNVWDYTIRLSDAEGWYHTVNAYPFG